VHFKPHAHVFHCIFCIAFLVSEADRSGFVCKTKKKGLLSVVLKAREVSVLEILWFFCGAEGVF